MSFITKRDRLFAENELGDVAPRNEGKLKAYASLVDARAWSHYNSDKSEHLFELIKRNTGKCQKLIPIDVIVNTLMGAKNAEIERLKGRINQVERLLSAYEKMDLTPEQKAHINKARAAISETSTDLAAIKGDGDKQRVSLFDADGNPIGGYDANGNPMVGGMYDANGNPISAPFFDANGNSVAQGMLDATGNPVGGFDANGNPMVGGMFDASGNPITGGTFDASGNPITGPLSDAGRMNTKAQLYDADGNPIGGFDANGNPAVGGMYDANGNPISAPFFDADGNHTTAMDDDGTCGMPSSRSDTCFSTCLSGFSGVSKMADVCPCQTPRDKTKEAKICSGSTKRKPCRIPVPVPDSRSRRSMDTRQNISCICGPGEQDSRPRASSNIPIAQDIRRGSCMDNRTTSRDLKSTPGSGIMKNMDTRSGTSMASGPGTLSAQGSRVIQGPKPLSARSSCISRGPDTLSAQGSCVNKDTGPNQPDYPCDNMDTLKQQILKKDAALAAMQNTISMLESDVCEPYCVYAKIYTMLEKILAILKQNPKYMKFLDAVTQTKDISELDLRAKIVFKLNVLEKFSSALTMGCKKKNHRSRSPCKGCQDTECYHAEVLSYLNPSFGVPNIDYDDLEDDSDRLKDDNRARLVAQIIETDDFNSVIQSINNDVLNETQQDDLENMAFNVKELQDCYDELLSAYSDLKDERDTLISKLIECEDTLQELEDLKYKYEELSRQNEYYQSFAEEANKVKEQSTILSEQVQTLENELKGQIESNSSYSSKLVQLSEENASLHKQIEDISLDFEEENNRLKYKVNELECYTACQETEIGSLAIKVETLMNSQRISESTSLADTMEINSFKRQLSNLKDLLDRSHRENDELQTKLAEYEKVLHVVQVEFHNIQGECEALTKRNHNLELDNDEFRKELDDKDREILYLTVKVNSRTQDSYADSQGETRSCPDNQLDYKGMLRTQNEAASSGRSNMSDEKLKEELISLTEKQSHSLSEKEASESYNVSNGQKDHDQESYLTDQDGVEKGSEESIKQPHKADQKLIDELHNITTAYDLLNNEKVRLETELLQYIENIPQQQEIESEITKMKNSYLRLKSENDDLMTDLSKQKQRENDLIVHNQRLQNLLDGNFAITQEVSLHDNLFVKQLEQEINQLRESNDVMKRENQKILNDLEHMRESSGVYENHFLSTKESFDKLNEEHIILKGEIEDLRYSVDSVKRERDCLLKDHENYVHRNSIEFVTLESHLSDIKESCTTLEQENENLKVELEQFKNDNNELMQERDSLMRLCEELNSSSENKEKDFENRLESLNEAYRKLEADHRNLKMKLAASDNDNGRMKNEMQELQNEISSLSEQKNDLFDKLNLMNKEKALPEVSSGLKDCLQEVEQLKMDILKNQNIIDHLSSQLESSDKKASEFNMELIQQTNKNSIMETQIAKLEEEITKLHGHLDSAILSGEDMKENSLKAVEKCLAETQAHHSRATHDIKAELMALQMSHLKSEETASLDNSDNTLSNHSSRISSKLFSLKKGRNSLEKHVEKLETATRNALKAVDNNGTSPRQTVNKSLDMISKVLDRQDLNYQNLERLYLEAKSSTQSIAGKYEELKEDYENVRNQYIKEKHDLEKQFDDERENLVVQIRSEKSSVQTLKDELMSKSRENENIKIKSDACIQELESELEILKDIYSNALHEISDLNKKNNALTNDNNRIQNILDISSEEMQIKLKDIGDLENELKNIKALMVHSHNDMTTQTDLENTINKKEISHSALALMNLPSINLPSYSVDNKNIQYTENISVENISLSRVVKEINSTPEPTTLETSNVQQRINLVRSIQSRSTLGSDEQASIIYSVRELSILQQAMQETDHRDSSINKLNIDILSLTVSSHSNSMHDSLKTPMVEPIDISSSSNKRDNFKALEGEKQAQADVKLSHTGTQTDEFVNSKILHDIEEYKLKIQTLTNTVVAGERDFNIKLAAIKIQFDNNMRNIINEHNEGIERMQILHEETVRDLIRQHESEIETLRAISAESTKLTESLTWKNKELRRKLSELMEEHKESAAMSLAPLKSKTYESLTITMVELFDIKPKKRHAPPVCVVDLSDIGKNCFEKGDTDDGKLAAQNFLKTIVKKVFDGGLEVLDLQELSYLHTKVCHLWRCKQPKDESNQKKMGTLEHDLLKKKQNTIQRIMELEAAVRDERKRLHEVRDTMYSDMISTDKLPPGSGCHCNDGVEMSSRVQDVPCTVSQKKSKVLGPRVVCKSTPHTSKQIQPNQYDNEPPTRLKDAVARKDM